VHSDVAVLQTSASSMDVVKQRYAQELGPFLAACSALTAGVLGHEGGATPICGDGFEAATTEQATNSVGDDASMQTAVARRQAQAAVAAQNFGRRKQTRDMLQRYQYLPTEISLHPFMVKAPAHPDDDVVTVGKTYAFFLHQGPSAPQKLKCVLGVSICWLLLSLAARWLMMQQLASGKSRASTIS